MKTINDFFSSADDASVLTIIELKSVKGGDDPVSNPDPDPFKKK